MIRTQMKLMVCMITWCLLLAIEVPSLAGERPGITPSSGVLGDRGAELYHAGFFQDAYDFYLSQLEKRGPDAALFVNMGHSLFKQGSYGAAVACYLQALHYDPRNITILRDIQVVSNKLGYGLVFDESSQDFLVRMTLYRILNEREILYVFGLCMILTSLLVSFLVWRPRSAVLWSFTAISFTLSAYLSVCLWAVSYHWPQWGAIRSDKGEVYSAPSSESGVVLFSLKQATPVVVLSAEKNWYKVRMHDGKMGWARKQDIAYYPGKLHDFSLPSLSSSRLN